MTDIMKVMDAAKCIMRQDGNMLQWGKNYPSESIILGDIERDSGYVIDDDGNVVAYFAFLPSPEPKVIAAAFFNIPAFAPTLLKAAFKLSEAAPDAASILDFASAN